MATTTSTHSSHHSSHRPTSIVRGIPATDEKGQLYSESTRAPVISTYATTTASELPSYHTNSHHTTSHHTTTQAIEATPAGTTTVRGYAGVGEVHQNAVQDLRAYVASTSPSAVHHSSTAATTREASHHLQGNLASALTGGHGTTISSTSTPFGEPHTQETRKLSSVVVESTILGDLPQQDGVRYVEVPTVEEQIKIVTRKEVREVEKRVSRPDVEWVEVVVPIPKIEYVDKRVEVPVIEYRTKEVRVPQMVDRTKEIIIEKKVTVPKVKEVTREVPGPVVERAVPYTVENLKEVVHTSNKEVPVVVAQTIKPLITESSHQLVVEALHYEPEIVPVDVHLARPVATSLEVIGKVDERHKLVTVSAAQYNTILRVLNAQADERVKASLPYIEERGTVPFVADHEAAFIVAPDHVKVEGYTPATRYAVSSSHQAPLTAVRETEAETIKSVQSHAPQKQGTRCCGPFAKRGVAEPSEPAMPSRHLSAANTDQRGYANTDDNKTITYDGQRSTLDTIPQLSGAQNAEGGSIRSQVHVVPSQQGTLPLQKSRVCC